MRAICEVCPKLTTKTAKLRRWSFFAKIVNGWKPPTVFIKTVHQRCFSVFIANFKQISHIALVFSVVEFDASLKLCTHTHIYIYIYTHIFFCKFVNNFFLSELSIVSDVDILLQCLLDFKNNVHFADSFMLNKKNKTKQKTMKTVREMLSNILLGSNNWQREIFMKMRLLCNIRLITWKYWYCCTSLYTKQTKNEKYTQVHLADFD